jgi:hypothetical protein
MDLKTSVLHRRYFSISQKDTRFLHDGVGGRMWLVIDAPFSQAALEAPDGKHGHLNRFLKLNSTSALFLQMLPHPTALL